MSQIFSCCCVEEITFEEAATDIQYSTDGDISLFTVLNDRRGSKCVWGQRAELRYSSPSLY